MGAVLGVLQLRVPRHAHGMTGRRGGAWPKPGPAGRLQTTSLGRSFVRGEARRAPHRCRPARPRRVDTRRKLLSGRKVLTNPALSWPSVGSPSTRGRRSQPAGSGRTSHWWQKSANSRNESDYWRPTANGWEAGIRTPITASRAPCATVERPPSNRSAAPSRHEPPTISTPAGRSQAGARRGAPAG